MKLTCLSLLCVLTVLGFGPLRARGQNFADEHEPNNTLGQATVLQADDGLVEERFLTIYPTGDVDYFKFTLSSPGQQSHYIEVNAAMSHPVLGAGRADFELLNAQGNVLASASTPLLSGSARISLHGRPAGIYHVKVEGRIGSYGWFNLTLQLPASTPPTITTHPQSRTVTAGSSVAFFVEASGPGALSYQWFKDGQPLSGRTSGELILTNVQSADAGTYTVEVRNSAGKVTSNPATLTVNPAAAAPTITTHPQSQTVTAGSTVTFTVVASGTPPLSYQWRKDGQVLAGQTSATLTLANVQAGQAGSYTVVVSNSAGQVTSNPATLTVNPAAVGPTITTHPQSQTVTAGASVTFSVAATGTPPLSYQWRKEGQALSGQTGATLALANVQASDAGSYTVVVSNSAGQVTSNPATLTVNPVGPPPGVAERILPVGYAPGVAFTVSLHLNAGEAIAAFGVEDGPPEGWVVSNISDGGEFDAQNRRVKWDPFFASSGRERTLTYQVTPPAGASGSFHFEGVASFDGINVPISGDQSIGPAAPGGAPVITAHPQSQTVSAGARVTFTVVATGAGPLSYQWRFNRVPIPGANASTLVLSSAQTSDAGSYTVMISNAHGTVASQPAILTVNPADGVRLSEARFVAREGFRFKVTAPVGQRWIVEASTDLRQWLEIGTLEMTSGIREFTDAEAVVFPRSFYRLRQTTP